MSDTEGQFRGGPTRIRRKNPVLEFPKKHAGILPHAQEFLRLLQADKIKGYAIIWSEEEAGKSTIQFGPDFNTQNLDNLLSLNLSVQRLLLDISDGEVTYEPLKES